MKPDTLFATIAGAFLGFVIGVATLILFRDEIFSWLDLLCEKARDFFGPDPNERQKK